ncbi:DNA replication protein [Roseibium album]|uniref:DNA replication protein n=1 Tax=Roseibium album TaxID=311410 RepID=A0A0M6ZL61_9HYPH|nr:DNA replication protein [Roseibium album]CTQ63704.1 DNA replication protein [Roseibium album]CTQ72221.1 DNA replication protein [Roseibium album]
MTAERGLGSVAYQLKVTHLPAYRNLNGFDLARSEVNEVLMRQLHRCEFIEQARYGFFLRGSETGVAHLATTLGIQAIEYYLKRFRFFSTVELVNVLEQERA